MVIGGGIIGISTAIELQTRGLDVVVVEKGNVAAEQSSRNWGWCRQMGRDPREIPLIKRSMAVWRGMNSKIGAETGFRTCGILYLADTDQELAQHQSWCDKNAKPHTLSSRMISAAEAANMQPGCARVWKGGLYTDNDGKAEPTIAVPAMAAYFMSRGGKILTTCAARTIERQAGRVCDVITERGAIRTSNAVLAGGYWSERFLANLGVDFPQAGVISSVLRTFPLDAGHTSTFCGNRFAARKRLDGGYTIAHNLYSVADLTPNHLRYAKNFMPLLMQDRHAVKLRAGRRFIEEFKWPRRWNADQTSPFEIVRIVDPKPVNKLLQDAMAALKIFYPAFEHLRIAETWAGMIDVTPDAVPVIDAITAVPGLFMASGFSGHGFGIGPGAGQLMADIVTGAEPCVDPAPFRFSRFSDGSSVIPLSGV